MKKLFSVLFLFFVLTSQCFPLALTKTQGTILDWTALGDTVSNNPFAETTIQTYATQVEIVLYVVVAHTDTNDAANNKVTVELLVRTGSDNESWMLHASLAAGRDQATSETLNANSGASEGGDEDQIHVASTADFDTGTAQWLFLKDNGTLVDSALVYIAGWVDATHYINAWDLVGSYDSSDVLYDDVDILPIRVPAGVQFFNVTFLNEDDDANYAVRVDYAIVSTIE